MVTKSRRYTNHLCNEVTGNDAKAFLRSGKIDVMLLKVSLIAADVKEMNEGEVENETDSYRSPRLFGSLSRKYTQVISRGFKVAH